MVKTNERSGTMVQRKLIYSEPSMNIIKFDKNSVYTTLVESPTYDPDSMEGGGMPNLDDIVGGN